MSDKYTYFYFYKVFDLLGLNNTAVSNNMVDENNDEYYIREEDYLKNKDILQWFCEEQRDICGYKFYVVDEQSYILLPETPKEKLIETAINKLKKLTYREAFSNHYFLIERGLIK